MIFGVGSLTVNLNPTPIPTLRVGITPTAVVQHGVQVKQPGISGEVKLPRFEKQTFNNCGPSTLSMVLAYFGISASAIELGEQIRPYQHPTGNNDDKTVFANEYAEWAEKYGLKAVVRPNGNINLLKKFVANGIPVTVKTNLHKDDDIAHFRIVRGWDDNRQRLLQDDSYEGKNKWYGYQEFEDLWRPFGKGYIVLYRPSQEELVRKIIGDDWDEQVAWQHAARDSEGFSLVVAHYHLGQYEEAVSLFEQIESGLPRRTMWYQIEPILSYQKLGNFDKVMQHTNKLINDGNRAYTELYVIRGEMYLAKGDKGAARSEFEKAVLYNKNSELARQALESLQ